MLHHIVLAASIGFVLGVSSFAASESGAKGSFIVDYSERPNPEVLGGFALAIVEPQSDLDPKTVHPDTRVLAYLSMVEVGQGGAFAAEVKKEGIDILATNSAWDADIVDLTNPAWREMILREVDSFMARGFTGVFLDTIDSIELMPEAHREQAWDTVIDLVAELREGHPEMEIVLNRGFVRASALIPYVDGVLVESLFHTFDHGEKTYEDVSKSDQAWLVKQISTYEKAGLPIYILDYLPSDDAERAAEAIRRIEALGYEGFISTPDLQGTIVASLQEVVRSILVLYGADPLLTEAPAVWASDCVTAGLLQMPLEWMGYCLKFHDVSRSGRISQEELGKHVGVIVDPGVRFPQADEGYYADLLCHCADSGIKLLLAGGMNFQQDAPTRRVLEHLKIGGAGDLVLAPQNPTVRSLDEAVMNFERDVEARAWGFRDFFAPDDAEVLLSLRSNNRYGVSHQFDPIFVAEWGGVLCDPYWNMQPSPLDILSFVDPFEFLGKIWPGDQFPVPDPTTRDGRRIFYSHIDGDGFTTLSRLKRGVTCAELVRDRILKKYPFPTTVSVIESEIRAQLSSALPEDTEKYQDLAREIFAMSQVEAASHSYSHPFVWDPERDINSVRDYRQLRLRFREDVEYPAIDVDREVRGSIDYINEHLLPEGKRVELMLWSGNCRPFPEAIRICNEIGVENMNGGQTVISKRHPHLASVAPRVAYWDGELQIHTANQNDYVYTKDWSGPLYGGFDQVIDSFQRLESPRRLKEVNVYYHFYSAANPSALHALERIHDWCLTQPLHSVTAAEAARIHRGAINTRIVPFGDSGWLLYGGEHSRTYRLAKSAGEPDIAGSSGITGSILSGDWRYVHTDGREQVFLKMVERAPEHLYLRESSADIHFNSLARTSARFRCGDMRAIEIRFGGLAPGTELTLSLVDGGELPELIQADDEGVIALRLPGDQSGDWELSKVHTTAGREELQEP